MNCFLSPRKGSLFGAARTLLARVRSALIADKHRAKTASPIRVTKAFSVNMSLRRQDRPTRNTGIKRVDCGPFASTFLASLVEDLSNDRCAVVVLEAKDVHSD